MGQVIEFPKKSLKVRMEDTIKDMRGSLKDMYTALDKVEKGYLSIEKQAHEMEIAYQDLMVAYLQEVGQDNVPFEWLDYCPYVGMEKDPVTGSIKITLLSSKELKNEK